MTRVVGGGLGRSPFGPQWVGGKETPQSVAAQVEDALFGRKKPTVLDPDDAEAGPLLAKLQPYRKKLARLAGDQEDDYRLVLAAGTIASIDQGGTVYVGRSFLLATPFEIQVGALAHEIGHRPQLWAQYRQNQPMEPEALEELLRLEETRADYFAGWALGQLGFSVEPLAKFLEALEDGPHPEYLAATLRGKTLREGHQAGHLRKKNLKKFFPELARMRSVSGDLGEG